MSKLTDKMRNALRGEPARMGFGARGAASRPPGIGLLADLGDNLDLAEAAAPLADALFLNVSPEDARQAATAAGKTIWGIDLGTKDATEARLTDAGADFVIVSDNSDASAIRASEIGTLLRISTAAPDSILRVLATLPIEAILPDQAASGRFKVSELLDVLRVGAMAAKPLILSITADFDMTQLVSLRDAGVAAVAVRVRSKRDIDALKMARETIAAFPPPPKKPRDTSGVFASVPQPAVASSDDEMPDIDE